MPVRWISSVITVRSFFISARDSLSEERLSISSFTMSTCSPMSERIRFFPDALLDGFDNDDCEIGESKALRSDVVLGVHTDEVDDPADEGLFLRCMALPVTDLNALRELYEDVRGFCGTKKEGPLAGGGDGEDASCLLFPMALGGLFRLTAFTSYSVLYSSTPSMLKGVLPSRSSSRSSAEGPWFKGMVEAFEGG
jgi:hypothetical protein